MAERPLGPSPDAPGFRRSSERRPTHLFVRIPQGLIDLGPGSVGSGRLSNEGLVDCELPILKPRR
ncbi:hypothetical protein [Embleya sp. NBC_00896]|uniref:hypothetical protein n=1 Tax=Embleya sp. NBC_00896 TaxID=2975961 RepID=UPI00387007B9|nr:hypothetical protein OG928_00685 [Embleya sp. NBC_00896]